MNDLMLALLAIFIPPVSICSAVIIALLYFKAKTIKDTEPDKPNGVHRELIDGSACGGNSR
jgi:hypothetical protein